MPLAELFETIINMFKDLVNQIKALFAPIFDKGNDDTNGAA